MGKAHFELNDYKVCKVTFHSRWLKASHALVRTTAFIIVDQSAQLALREMLRLEPFRVRGTEILSTTLWHLKREKELCALAQQVRS